MKRCSHCRKRKGLSSFHKDSTKHDGHASTCKPCARNRARKHREDNIEQARRHDRIRSHTPERMLHFRRKSERNRETGKQSLFARTYAAKFPEKEKAKSALNGAVASGKIRRQPCAVCGNSKSEGHHEDYSKPLDVVWLCKKHHAYRHRVYDDEGEPIDDRHRIAC